MVKSISQIVRAARIKKGMTEVEVAAKSGLSEATIKRIEKGWPPNMQSLRAVIDVLGLKMRVGM